MKTHLYHSGYANFSACGKYAAKLESELLAVNCLNCRRTYDFAWYLPQRLAEIEDDFAYVKAHLREVLAFEAYVLAWDPLRQHCELALVCSATGKKLLQRVRASYWHRAVQPGDRVMFTAAFRYRWYEAGGLQVDLAFHSLLRVIGSQPEKTGSWHWTLHARKRQLERQIPEEAVVYALEKGTCKKSGSRMIYRMPKLEQSLPDKKAWSSLKVITEGHAIVTLFRDSSY